jgi:hypothetical protein
MSSSMSFFGITALGPTNLYISNSISICNATKYTNEMFAGKFQQFDPNGSGSINLNDV